MTQATTQLDREDQGTELLNEVFFALSDPIRRAILDRLDEGSLLVSELAAPFAISLQAVSRHIQVLARAGLVRQQRSGRISRCSLETGPISAAAVWINRYSKYWQAQFASRGYPLSPADVAFREAVAALDLPSWYATNVHLFERQG